MIVGRFAVRVSRQFSRLKAGSVKAALSRPAHQPPAGTTARRDDVRDGYPIGALHGRKPLARSCQ
jgi:hypothetical protein